MNLDLENVIFEPGNSVCQASKAADRVVRHVELYAMRLDVLILLTRGGSIHVEV